MKNDSKKFRPSLSPPTPTGLRKNEVFHTCMENDIKRMSLKENDQSLCCYRELKKEEQTRSRSERKSGKVQTGSEKEGLVVAFVKNDARDVK